VEAADAAALPRSSIVLLDDGREPALVDLHRIQDFLASPHSWEVIKDPQVLTEKVAVLNFSSGTTGNPKACMITHRNLVANAEQTLHLDEVARERSSSMNHSSHETHCAFLPLYHASGLLTYCIVNLRRSCTTVVMRKFSLRLLLSTIQRFRVTSLFLAPPVVLMLVESDLLSQYDLSSVELLLCGGAPLQPEQSRKLEAVFGDGRVRSRQGWGMTEATMAVTLFAPDEFDPSHKGVGYLVANMQMKIVADDGSQVGYCEEGEAFVRGPNVFKGYYKNQSASQQAFDWMGWMRTGDIVTIQRSGLVTVVNRKKELIKVKGFQVAPSELEGHLLEHPGVKDCAVTRIILNGQEHPQAHIVARDSDVTAESIMEFLQGRLSAHKRITGGIVFTKSIPKSASGKILRWMLQDPGHARLTHL
jgi:4-coumarate--CoA ligase